MCKKYYIFLILITSCLFAKENTPPIQSKSSSWLFGLGIEAKESIYKQMEDDKKPIPIIRYEDKNLYWHTLEAGYKVCTKESAMLALAIKARLDSYDSSDSIYFQDMSNRDRTMEFGLRRDSYLTKEDIISYSIFKDIGNKHKGYELGFEYKHTIKVPYGFILLPYLKAEYLNDKLVDYYYGVKKSESNSWRSEYNAKSATNLIVGLKIQTKIKQNWMFLMDYKYKKLDRTITESPIVEESSQKQLMMAIVYKY